MIKLNVNGKQLNVEASPDTPLLWVLRDDLNKTVTKYVCGMAMCGACTVWLNGVPTRACQTPVSAVVGQNVTTVEDIAATPAGKAVQAAWRKLDVVQCGFCQSGQIMAAAALLVRNKRPTDADIDAAMAGNICRCATYVRIRAAIKEAASTLP